MTSPHTAQEGRARPQHWAVTISVDGDQILTIETGWLSGVEDIERHTDTIRRAADHLLAFIGHPPAPPPEGARE